MDLGNSPSRFDTITFFFRRIVHGDGLPVPEFDSFEDRFSDGVVIEPGNHYPGVGVRVVHYVFKREFEVFPLLASFAVVIVSQAAEFVKHFVNDVFFTDQGVWQTEVECQYLVFFAISITFLIRLQSLFAEQPRPTNLPYPTIGL